MRALVTVPGLLAERVRADPSRPAVTWLDPASGARVELSRATLANWVAKVGGLLQDVVDVTAGERVRLDLPAHWLGVCWPLACWSVGAVVATGDEPADVHVVGDESEPPAAAGRLVVVGTSPLGGRSRVPVPPGALDAGAEVLGQPDDLLAYEPPVPSTPATDGHDHAELLASAADRATELGLGAGTRLATDLPPTDPAGLVETVLAPLVADAALVLVVGGVPADALAPVLSPERPDVLTGTLRH